MVCQDLLMAACLHVLGPALLAVVFGHLLCLSIKDSVHEDQAKKILQLVLKVTFFRLINIDYPGLISYQYSFCASI